MRGLKLQGVFADCCFGLRFLMSVEHARANRCIFGLGGVGFKDRVGGDEAGKDALFKQASGEGGNGDAVDLVRERWIVFTGCKISQAGDDDRCAYVRWHLPVIAVGEIQMGLPGARWVISAGGREEGGSVVRELLDEYFTEPAITANNKRAHGAIALRRRRLQRKQPVGFHGIRLHRGWRLELLL